MAKTSAPVRSFVAVSLPTPVKLVPGQVVEGTFKGEDVVELDGKKVPQFQFERDDKSSFTVLGTVMLSKYMELVKAGSYVRITVGSMAKGTKGREYATYTVEVAS